MFLIPTFAWTEILHPPLWKKTTYNANQAPGNYFSTVRWLRRRSFTIREITCRKSLQITFVNTSAKPHEDIANMTNSLNRNINPFYWPIYSFGAISRAWSRVFNDGVTSLVAYMSRVQWIPPCFHLIYYAYFTDSQNLQSYTFFSRRKG